MICVNKLNNEMQDGTYSIVNGEIVEYASKWSYGYIVGVGTIVAANVGRYPTVEELLTIAPKGLFGVWYDHKGGQCYIDHVQHIDTLQGALQVARQNNELAIYGLYSEAVIYVDSEVSK